jgi:hypothetical protein
MSADLDGLNLEPPILQLLAYYSPVAPEDRDRWRDRIMEWPEASERDLVRWHGTLVAEALIEQNTGQTPAVGVHQVRGCYRLTQLGRRLVRKLSQVAATS